MNRMIRKLPLQGTLATAVFAGLAGTAVSAVTDRLLDRLVSEKQKKQDRRVRKGTAHEMAGPVFMEKITGKAPDENEKKRARVAFSITYSLIWGVIYGGMRRKVPALAKAAGMPFAIPFFFACDGLMAPLLGISPNLRRVPWQPSLKEMANHIAWTSTAEMVHRAAGR